MEPGPGSMNGAKFLAYVKLWLAPRRARYVDNLAVHKESWHREVIEARGATLRYLPQYSPDLNPIEIPFRTLKVFPRKAAERTILACDAALASSPAR
jgi:transposase